MSVDVHSGPLGREFRVHTHSNAIIATGEEANSPARFHCPCDSLVHS